MVMARISDVLGWIGHVILSSDPLPRADTKAEHATDETIKEAIAATHEFEQLKRRAKAVGIDVDLSRTWRPRGER